MENYKTVYGSVQIAASEKNIILYTKNKALGCAEIEQIMQKYINLNPMGGKQGQNEVQRAEYFDDENVWAAEIM